MGGTQVVEGYRVVAVLAGSPLAQAGLQVYLDIILSANGMPLRPNGTFTLLVSHHAGRKLTLQVFNLWSRQLREVTVVPQEDWGGAGLLGGSIRYEAWDPKSIGVRIVRVLAGSQAEKAGLQPGELILGTASSPVTSIDQLCALLQQDVILCVFNPSSSLTRSVPLPLCPQGLGIEAEAGLPP